jgi:hypothetical protein
MNSVNPVLIRTAKYGVEKWLNDKHESQWLEVPT